MNWLVNTFTSSVGKKFLMMISGFSFIGFIIVHLAGNLTVYGGQGMFIAYSDHLHSYGPLLKIAELALLALAAVHIITGAVLFFQNRGARPVRYQQDRRAGGRTWASVTMPYTGLLILVFVIWHLINFHFADRTNATIYDIVSSAFQNPLYVLGYVISMAIVALHISHGFWSAFQTIGANHPKFMPFINRVGLALSIVVGVGFGSIPIYLALMV
jgi:succinate dehydrogenase / fumarate reductase cytochrome b subunit